MSRSRARRRLSSLLTGAVTSALAGALLVTMPVAAGSAGAAPAATPPTDCPVITPVAQIHAGMHGTGWTVTTGTTPRPFNVDILGVAPDAIGPGRSMIIIEISDVPGRHFVDRAGGIWAGMSGSPIYVNGKLVGAVSYGFSTGPSHIGGATPAADMHAILAYPGATPAAAGATRIKLSGALRSTVARRTRTTAAAVSSLSRLPIPLAVSGLSDAARKRLQDRFDRAGDSVIVVAGSRTAAPSGEPAFARPVAGGNFAALLSYGDVTAGGVGTTTWVCGDRALAFGHPLLLNGRSTFGANDATSLAIVTDPTTGPFKLANITRLFGILDQDRTTAIRAHLGVTPTLIPVTAKVRSLELGTTRTGETDITMSDFVSALAPEHLWSDINAATDRSGPGSALLHWVIRGTRSDGTPWVLTRTNRVASNFDIASQSAFALDDHTFTLAENRFDDITFTSIDINATVSPRVRAETVTGISVSKNGGAFKTPTVLKVHRGDSLVVRVRLRVYQGAKRTIDVPLSVPSDTPLGSGQLSVTGGADVFGSSCEFDPSSCPKSFPALLHFLATAPRNDDVVVDLGVFGDDGTFSDAVATGREPAVVGGSVQLQAIVQ